MANVPKKTMVCVTVQRTCERLIREGAAIAGEAGLSVVHVARNGEKLLGGGNDAEALDYLYRVAREYGAEMDMLRSNDIITSLTGLIKKSGIECVVLGAAGTGSSLDLAGALQACIPGITVIVIT